MVSPFGSANTHNPGGVDVGDSNSSRVAQNYRIKARISDRREEGTARGLLEISAVVSLVSN